MKLTTLILALLLLVPSAAFAGDPDPKLDDLLSAGPDALLKEADNRHNPFKDQTITVKMVMHGGSNDGNELQFKSITKGENMRAIRFEAPADMKGMGVVIKGRDVIYVRLPDSEKVRRVGTHAKRQGFYGSDWNFDDMSIIRFGADYSAKLDKQTDTHVILELTRRKDVDLPYPKLVLHIDKSRIMIDKIEYFDEDGKKVKVQERFDPKDLGGGYEIYSRVVMTDLVADHSTENLVQDEAIDQNVDDSTFSRRWLVRGL